MKDENMKSFDHWCLWIEPKVIITEISIMLIELNNSHEGFSRNFIQKTARVNMRQGYFVDSLDSSGRLEGRKRPRFIHCCNFNFECYCRAFQSLGTL